MGVKGRKKKRAAKAAAAEDVVMGPPGPPGPPAPPPLPPPPAVPHKITLAYLWLAGYNPDGPPFHPILKSCLRKDVHTMIHGSFYEDARGTHLKRDLSFYKGTRAYKRTQTGLLFYVYQDFPTNANLLQDNWACVYTFTKRVCWENLVPHTDSTDAAILLEFNFVVEEFLKHGEILGYSVEGYITRTLSLYKRVDTKMSFKQSGLLRTNALDYVEGRGVVINTAFEGSKVLTSLTSCNQVGIPNQPVMKPQFNLTQSRPDSHVYYFGEVYLCFDMNEVMLDAPRQFVSIVKDRYGNPTSYTLSGNVSVAILGHNDRLRYGRDL